MRTIRALTSLVAGLVWVFGATAPGHAQSIPKSAYDALRWRSIGPFRGGRVLAVAGIPGNPATFYFGAVGGGVWKTTNAGVTWTALFDGQPVASIGALAVAPSNPSILYAGTGEAALRSDITFGGGAYRSSDGGAHWTHLGLDDTRHIGKVVVDPENPNLVFVAAVGHVYGSNAERGVFRSTDGGQTWARVLYRDSLTGAIDLAQDPAHRAVLFAALWQAHRPPWSQYPPDEGQGAGLFRSLDGGTTWSELSGHGLPKPPLGRIGLAVSAGSEGTRVYALIGAREGGGLYRSEDQGTTWRLVGTDPRLTNRNWYFCRVSVDPTNPDIVYVPNVALLKSTDGGAHFAAIKGAPGGDDYHELWIDPKSPERMILGSDQGAIVSLDGARTWSSWYNQPTAQFYHVAVDEHFPYRVYGAQQDAGTAATLSRSDYGTITFREWQPVGAGESGYIAPDPLDSDVVYGGDTYGGAFRFDRVTGQSQEIAPSPLSAFGVPMPERKYRFTWTSPLVFDRLDRHVLYFGAQMLLATRDGGLHWTPLSPDLTGAKPASAGTVGGGPPTLVDAASRGYGVIYTVAPSPLRAGMIWVGTDDGLIQLTEDGGGHWQNVTPAGLSPWSKISLIETSPFDTAAAYAAVDRHRLDDLAPYVYRTRDAGRHWTRIDVGIAPHAYVQVVRADPVRRGLLYAGTELGTYVSFDDGDHWQSLQLNLPTVSVRDLAVHGSDLVAATHGRSFWILDDVTPLREVTEDALRAPAFLFRPAPAVRLRRSEGHDTPLPPEEPHGTNPPAGAVIDYALGSPAPVALEILDNRGNVVRRFSSEAKPEVEPETPQIAPEWLPRSESASAHAGHNRFVWDLRYAPPSVERHGYSIAAIPGEGTVAEPEGPLVLPGDYQIRLTVAGRSYAQPLTVAMDPRVRVGREALVEQLKLALEIWNAAARQHALHSAVRRLRDDVRHLDGRELGADTRASVTLLAEQLDTLALRTGSGALGSLETVVLSADREPTAQARAAFGELRARLGELEKRWEDMRARVMPAVNERLARERVTSLRALEPQADTLALP